MSPGAPDGVSYGVEVQDASFPGDYWRFRCGWFAEKDPTSHEPGLDRARRNLESCLKDPAYSNARIVRRVTETTVVDPIEYDTAARCPDCGHSRTEHDTPMPGAGKRLLPEYNPTGQADLFECSHYAGMGESCGCERWSRDPVSAKGGKGWEDLERRRRGE